MEESDTVDDKHEFNANHERGELVVINVRSIEHLQKEVGESLSAGQKIGGIRLCFDLMWEVLRIVIAILHRNDAVDIFQQETVTSISHGKKSQTGTFYKVCQLEADAAGEIHVDLLCTGLSRDFFFEKKIEKVRYLILRGYHDCPVLDERCRIDCLQELIISDGIPGERKLVLNVGENNAPIPLLSSFRSITFETCNNRMQNLYPNSKLCTISMHGLKNLKRWFMNCEGKQMIVEGMDQLNDLEELVVFNTQLCNNIISDPSTTKLKKLLVVNCGLDGSSIKISMETLEVVQLSRILLGLNLPNSFSSKNLRELQLSSCELECLPGGIEHCSNLQDLNLNDNPRLGQNLVSFPKLGKLNTLSLCNCGLSVVPDGLTDLGNLENLALDGNKLSGSEMQLMELWGRNVSITVSGNRLTGATRNYPPISGTLSDSTKQRRNVSSNLRMMVIGEPGMGKTTFLNALFSGKASPSRGSAEIEIRQWFLNARNADLLLQVWNVNTKHQSISNLFLRDGNLFLLPVDLSVYETTKESYEENIGRWIEMVKRRVQHPVVVLALIRVVEGHAVNKHHRELWNVVDEEKCQHMKKMIAEYEQNNMDPFAQTAATSDASQIEWGGGQNHGSSHPNSLPVPTNAGNGSGVTILFLDKSFLVKSTFSKQLAVKADPEPEWIQKTITAVYDIATNINLFPFVNFRVPEIRLEIQELILQLKEGTDGPKYMAFGKLEERLCKLSKSFKDDLERSTTLKMSLSYLARLGHVLLFEQITELQEFVFLDPNWLNSLFEKVVCRNLLLQLDYKEDFQEHGLDMARFSQEITVSCEKGFLSYSLLRCIWHNEVPTGFFHVLHFFGIGFKMTSELTDEARSLTLSHFLIPNLLPEMPTKQLNELWPIQKPDSVLEIRSVAKFSCPIPVGLFEEFMARCFSVLVLTDHWKNGIFGVSQSDHAGRVKVLITKQQKKLNSIIFEARLKSTERAEAMWETILPLQRVLASIVSKSWSKYRFTVYNRCPDCRECHQEMNIDRRRNSQGLQGGASNRSNQLVYPLPEEIIQVSRTDPCGTSHQRKAVLGNEASRQKLTAHGTRQRENGKAYETLCNSLIIFSEMTDPTIIVSYIHDEVSKMVSGIFPLVWQIRNDNVLIVENGEEKIGVIVTHPVKRIIRVAITSTMSGTSPSEKHSNTICYLCSNVLDMLKNILTSEQLNAYILMNCQGKSLFIQGEEITSIDKELITRIESLVEEQHQIQKAMTELVLNDLSAHLNTEDYQRNQATMEGLCEIKSKYQMVKQSFNLLESKILEQRKTRTTAEESRKCVGSLIQSTDVQQDGPSRSSSLAVNAPSDPTQGNGTRGEYTCSTPASDPRYPLPILLEIFARDILGKEWKAIRLVLSCYVPPIELSHIPDGVAIFHELVRRNLICNENLRVLRQIFFEIQRFDYVHLIDCIAEGDYHLLEERNRGEQDAMASVTTSDSFPVSFAVKGTRGSTIGSDRFESASTVQADGNGNDGAKSSGGRNDLQLPRSYGNSLSRSPAVTSQDVLHVTTDGSSGIQGKFNTRRITDDSYPDSGHNAAPRNQNERNESMRGGVISIGTDAREANAGRWNAGGRNSNVVHTGSAYAGGTSAGGASGDVTGATAGGAISAGAIAGGATAGGATRDVTGSGERNYQEIQHIVRNAEVNDDLAFSCDHYDRYCEVQFSCCNARFWPCHRCHNSDKSCQETKLRARDIKKIKCNRCKTVQEFPKQRPNCQECGLKFSEYFCAICQHLTGRQNNPYHCEGCGICRVNEDRSFHCDTCGVCLDVHLLENHLCRAGSAHDECCICFEDAFTGCQILPCSHKVHKECARMMLNNGMNMLCYMDSDLSYQEQPNAPKQT